MTQVANAVMELAHEHDEIDTLALRIATLGRGPEREALVREVGVRFRVHARAEERYLYPAVRRLLSDGIDLACLQTRRNRALANTIESLEQGVEEGDGLDILVGQLVVALQDHVERQECVLLPALIAACPVEEYELLGRELHEGIRAARETIGLWEAWETTDDREPASSRGRGFRAMLRRCFAPGRRAADADY